MDPEHSRFRRAQCIDPHQRASISTTRPDIRMMAISRSSIRMGQRRRFSGACVASLRSTLFRIIAKADMSRKITSGHGLSFNHFGRYEKLCRNFKASFSCRYENDYKTRLAELPFCTSAGCGGVEGVLALWRSCGSIRSFNSAYVKSRNAQPRELSRSRCSLPSIKPNRRRRKIVSGSQLRNEPPP